MDPFKTGAIIAFMRKKMGLTQKQLAQHLHVSDKAVSKWERGLGIPDVSLLQALCDTLGISLEAFLAGDLSPEKQDGGNMKRLQFYFCPDCGNMITATGKAELSCCGKKLSPTKAVPLDEAHLPTVERSDGDYFLTFDHNMTKDHYLRFVACLDYDRLHLVRLYPEQNPQLRLPSALRGTLLVSCNQHGLFSLPISSLLKK